MHKLTHKLLAAILQIGRLEDITLYLQKSKTKSSERNKMFKVITSIFVMLHFEPLVFRFCLALGEEAASLKRLNKVFWEEKNPQHCSDVYKRKNARINGRELV